MTLPFQIYCDYLEDKGIDVRLLRIMEIGNTCITNFHRFDEWYDVFMYGSGNSMGYGNDDGEGRGGGRPMMWERMQYGSSRNGSGFGFGYGEYNGDGFLLLE